MDNKGTPKKTNSYELTDRSGAYTVYKSAWIYPRAEALRPVFFQANTVAGSPVRFYETWIEFEVPASSWAGYCSGLSTRLPTVFVNDQAISREGAWTEGLLDLSSSTVGDRLTYIVASRGIYIRFPNGATGATCDIYVDGYRIAEDHAVGTSQNYFVGLDGSSEHYIEVEVKSGTVQVGRLGRVFDRDNPNFLSLRSSDITVYDWMKEAVKLAGGEVRFDTLAKVIDWRDQQGRDLYAESVHPGFYEGINIIGSTFENQPLPKERFNRVRVVGYGEGTGQIRVDRTAPGTESEKPRWNIVNDSEIKDKASASMRAEKEALKGVDPGHSYVFQVPRSQVVGVRAGDRVVLVYPSENISDKYRVLEIERFSDKATATISLGDRAASAARLLATWSRE
jgi:hypothetical protein